MMVIAPLTGFRRQSRERERKAKQREREGEMARKEKRRAMAGCVSLANLAIGQ